VAALKAHPSIADVAESACAALRNIAGIETGQAACVSAGAVPAIVAALKAHPNVAAVAEKACMALLNISIIWLDKQLHPFRIAKVMAILKSWLPLKQKGYCPLHGLSVANVSWL
jgi:hypothetical protein